MPSVNFDVANSFYNFICFLGVFVILMPQVFIYFLKDESMWDTYKALNSECGIIFWIILAIFKIIGSIILIMGIYHWYKKSQYYLDLKQKKETLKLIAASDEEIRKKENQKQKSEQADYNRNKSNKGIDFDTIKYLDNPKAYEDAFYSYIVNQYNKEYEIYRNVRFDFAYGGNNSLFCDIVLKAKNKEEYILYEVKGGYFSIVYVGKIKNYFMSLLHSQLFHKCKNTQAIIVFIVANEDEKEKINRYYAANKDYFKDETVNVEIKTYLISEIKMQ